MAHEFESGFFTKTPAWHRLGTVVQEVPTIEDAIKLAGLDWRVVEYPLTYSDNTTWVRDVDTHKALVRDSDNKCLGVVSNSFVSLQNIDAFKFFNPVLETGHATLEAAGALKGGKHVWVLAKLRNTTAEILPGDQVDGYLLLSNSHDGSRAVRVQFTAIRVVCWNTLSAAHQAGDEQRENCLRVLHRSGIVEGLQAVQQMLDLTGRTFRCSVEAYQALARKGITVEGLREYVSEVFTIEPSLLDNSRVYTHVERFFEDGRGATIPGVRGTFWGAYNAVTEYVGHARGKDEDSRLDSTWFGTGKGIADRALQLALAA